MVYAFSNGSTMTQEMPNLEIKTISQDRFFGKSCLFEIALLVGF
jgi:hypothetical protein